MSKCKLLTVKTLVCMGMLMCLLNADEEVKAVGVYKEQRLISVTQTLEENVKKALYARKMETTSDNQEECEEKVLVKANTAKVWSEANNDGEVVALISEGEEYRVLEKNGNYVKIILEEKGIEGYVAVNAVDIKEVSMPALVAHIADAEQNQKQLMESVKEAEKAVVSIEQKTEETENREITIKENVSATESIAYQNVMAGGEDDETLTKKERELLQIVNYAKQFLGNPYRYGGSSLTKGTDCSGFTMRIYEHFGVSIPRSSSQQSRVGKAVSFNKLQPGDLLFYGHGRSVGHVAMYIGDGKVIHASTDATGIKISDAFYRKPIRARRIVG